MVYCNSLFSTLNVKSCRQPLFIGIKTDIHSFSGGYFFLNNDDNAVVIGNNKLACYPTAHVRQKDEVYSLDPIWKSDDLVKLIIGHKHVIDDAENVLYVAMGYSI